MSVASKKIDKFKKVLQSIERIKSDDLREKLSEYYLKNYQKRSNTYSSDGGFTLWHKLNVNFAKWMNELNTPELEYFIDYCLSFHEDDFIIFMEYVYLICSQFNLELKGMCSNYLRYSGKDTKEKMFDSIMIPKCDIVEINQLIDCVFETEKQHFLNCYELASNNETFCENCIPYCLVKTEDGKKFKRTAPYRV